MGSGHEQKDRGSVISSVWLFISCILPGQISVHGPKKGKKQNSMLSGTRISAAVLKRKSQRT